MATITLPALLATALSVATGNEGWIVLVGVYLLLGVALDAGIYSWLIRYQPPWMTGVLGLVEFGLLYVLANLLEVGLTPAEAIFLYWASWLLAYFTKIVLLPIVSLTYLESAAEFRRPQWSIPPSQASLPVLASAAEGSQAGPLVRAASGAHAVPLQPKPSPSGVHAAPSQVGAGGATGSGEAR